MGNGSLLPKSLNWTRIDFGILSLPPTMKHLKFGAVSEFRLSVLSEKGKKIIFGDLRGHLVLAGHARKFTMTSVNNISAVTIAELILANVTAGLKFGTSFSLSFIKTKMVINLRSKRKMLIQAWA